MDPFSSLLGGLGGGMSSSSSATASANLSLSTPFIDNADIDFGGTQTGGQIGESNPSTSGNSAASSATAQTTPPANTGQGAASYPNSVTPSTSSGLSVGAILGGAAALITIILALKHKG